jgi:PAS domain S-box-containing protein
MNSEKKTVIWPKAIDLGGKISIVLFAMMLILGLVVASATYFFTRYQLAEGSQAALVIIVALVFLGTLGLVWFAVRMITAPLDEIVRAAEQIAANGLTVTRLIVSRSDGFGRISVAFNTMLDRLAESYAEQEQRVAERTREYEESRYDTERASNLLRESVSSISQGFTIYDENDRLVLCNEAYLNFYAASRDLIVPGNSFEEIVRRGAERGQYQEAIDCVDSWVQKRVAQHQNANGKVIEQQLGDGRWLMIVEYRTPSGYIVGNRVDITELKRTSEALRLRELYLRATLDNLPFLFWLKDTDSRFLAVNKRFSDACGQPSPESVVGLTDQDIWPLALADAYRANDVEVMTSRCERMVEESIAGGGWIETFKKPVFADEGTTLGTVGFARDISARRFMQQALFESEQRWSLAMKGANDGIWDWNPKQGTVYFSERWKSMLGYAAEELTNSYGEWNQRIHSEDRDRTLAALERHLAGKDEFYQCEYRLQRKDGSYLWVLDRGQAKFDSEGNALRMAGSLTDITMRREAEARIRDRNEQLNAIFDLSPDGFVSFDAEQLVKYASPAFLRMTGIEEGEILGLDESAFDARLILLCVDKERFPRVSKLRMQQESGDTSFSHRQTIELSGPGKRVLEMGLRLARSETVSQILYFRDITHETEVDRLKTEFLSTAAHELRTPMASIYGFTELLLAESFEEAERTDFLETIYRQSGLMNAILNELLDLSRIEARRGKDFKIERIDLAPLLGEVVAGFMPPSNRQRPVQDSFHLPGADTIWIRGDRNKLMQAISNVLSNAYKYSPDGGPVELEVIQPHSSSESKKSIGIRVADHGIGMNSLQLSRVCERFYRADTSGKIPGTGLGMSIVKEIIELHSGKLEFASQPGLSTVVTLWLPLCTEVGAPN